MNENLMKKLKRKGAMEIPEEIQKNGQQLSDSDQQILVDELKRLFQDQFVNDNFKVIRAELTRLNKTVADQTTQIDQQIIDGKALFCGTEEGNISICQGNEEGH